MNLRNTFTPLSLADRLDRQTVRGTLWRTEGPRVRCFACGHRCLIAEGRRGICRVRHNAAGELRVPFGYVAGLQCDPVEKKPFFHVEPGADALTFGMLGCDFHCGYCQNWVTSQALRDATATGGWKEVTPAQVVEAAMRQGARLLVSSYNEPLITAEWARAIFELGQPQGLRCAFVSNGNITSEALDYLGPYLSAYKVDLKGFNDRNYRTLGGTLDHVLDGIRLIHDRGIWLEVVTLLVPGFNDSEAELRDLTGFLCGINPDIPWHVTAFHPDYKMTGPPMTTPAQLCRAAEIGRESGLRFVYAGNAPGRVGEWEHTRCPKCGATVIARHGYHIQSYHLNAQGQCGHCAGSIPGLWPVAAVKSSPLSQPRGPRRVEMPGTITGGM